MFRDSRCCLQIGYLNVFQKIRCLSSAKHLFPYQLFIVSKFVCISAEMHPYQVVLSLKLFFFHGKLLYQPHGCLSFVSFQLFLAIETLKLRAIFFPEVGVTFSSCLLA